MPKFLLLLPILFPILASAAIYLLPQGREKAGRILTFSVTFLCAAFTLAAVIFMPSGSFTLVDFGKNAGVSLGLSFGLDGAGRFFALLISILWPLAQIYAFGYLRGDGKQPVFNLFYTMSFGATCGIAFAGNLLTMYVFYEMLTLTTIPLVLHGYTRAHRLATVKYAAYSLGGAAFGFMGLMYLLFRNGSTDFVFGGYGGSADALTQVMFLMCFFGFGVKAAIFPLSFWLPEVTVAPTPVTALLHAVAVVKAGAFALIRIVYCIFGAETLRGGFGAYIALGTALFTMLFGAALALRSGHLKKRLAWSTVSNLSYIAAGIMLLTNEGLYAALFHTFAHALAKIALFFAVGIFMQSTGKERVTDLEGVGRKMPLTFAAYATAACSLVGIPVFIGFSSKWQLMTAAAKTGGVWGILTIAALLIAALLTAIYCFVPVIRAFFPKEGQDLYADLPKFKVDPRMLVPTVIPAAATVLAGVFSGPLYTLLTGLFK